MDLGLKVDSKEGTAELSRSGGGLLRVDTGLNMASKRRHCLSSFALAVARIERALGLKVVFPEAQLELGLKWLQRRALLDFLLQRRPAPS